MYSKRNKKKRYDVISRTQLLSSQTYRDAWHGTLQAKETLKNYEIRHSVASFDGGDNLVFFAYSYQILAGIIKRFI